MDHYLNTATSPAPNTAVAAAVLKRRPEPIFSKSAPKADVSNLTNEQLIGAINTKSATADDQVIQSAFMVRGLRRRVEAGDFGPDINWYEWAWNTLHRGETRLKELNRISNAKNPVEELNRLRGNAIERAKRHVTKNEVSKEMQMRNRVARFAKKAPIDKVQMLDDLVCKLLR
jgi:hypothetical protein